MKKKKLVSIIGACAVASAAIAGIVDITTTGGNSDHLRAVADGQAASSGQYPFSVKFTMTNVPQANGAPYNSACSGALISPQWVLTAGHCFHDINRKNVSGPPQYATTATVGKTDLSDAGGHVLQVVDVRQSPVNDIALAKLASPVTDITPATIARTAPQLNERLKLAGWGATAANNPPSTHLNLGTFKVSDLAETTIGVQGVAPSADTSACTYDSGSPYFVPFGDDAGAVVSVESQGPACPHTSAETTSRVDVVANWIDQQIGDSQ